MFSSKFLHPFFENVINAALSEDHSAEKKLSAILSPTPEEFLNYRKRLIEMLKNQTQRAINNGESEEEMAIFRYRSEIACSISLFDDLINFPYHQSKDTLLHILCSFPVANSVIMLLERSNLRINFHLKNRKGQTALHLACRCSSFRTVQALLAAAKKQMSEENFLSFIYAVDNNGNNVFHYAISNPFVQGSHRHRILAALSRHCESDLGPNHNGLNALQYAERMQVVLSAQELEFLPKSSAIEISKDPLSLPEVPLTFSKKKENVPDQTKAREVSDRSHSCSHRV